MSGGGGSSSTIQKSDPWSGQQGYLADIFRQGQNIYQNNPSSYYPGQTYQPWNQLQQSGIDTMLGSIPDQQRIANQSGNLFGQLANSINLNAPLAQQYQNALQADMTGNIQSAVGDQSRAYDSAYGRTADDLASLREQQMRNYGVSAGRTADDLTALREQQMRNYGVSAGRTADDLAALRERQLRDYGVSRNLLTEDLTRNILPGISSDAVGAGMAGSTRQGIAEGLAIANAQNRLAEIGRTQDETLASQLRASGLSLGDLSRTQDETYAAQNRAAGLSLGDLARQQAGTLGDVTRNLGTNANMNMANFMAGQYGQGLDTAKSALAMAPATQGMYGMPGQSLYGIGEQVYGQQTLPLQESINRYNYNQQAPWNDLNMYSSIVNGLPAGLGTTTASGSAGGSQFGSAAGGALTGMGIAQGLSSPFGAALFGGTPTLAGLGAAGTLGLYGLGGALLGGML